MKTENSFIANLRSDYSGKPLDKKDVTANPIEQFNAWFSEAIKAQVPEPNAMTLATTMVDFKPSARIVLLKGVEDGGFIFFTNYESRKGMELMWNPYAALVFFWQELSRQVRIEGRVEKISPEASTAYFHSRPIGSQLSAAVSPQSKVVEGRELLEKQVNDLEKQLGDKDIERPGNWGGYRVIPHLMEFWQGRPNRLHDRLRYTFIKAGEWKIERLAP